MGRIKAVEENFKRHVWICHLEIDYLLKKKKPTRSWCYFNYSYFSCCCNCLQGNPAESQFIKMKEQEDSPFIIVDLNPARDKVIWVGRSLKSHLVQPPFKAGITSTLDQDAQSLVQSCKTKRKIPVLNRFMFCPSETRSPFHKNSWQQTEAKQQKFKMK